MGVLIRRRLFNATNVLSILLTHFSNFKNYLFDFFVSLKDGEMMYWFLPE